jgi:peptide deformylase
MLSIVPVDKIPIGQDVPIHHEKVWPVCLELQELCTKLNGVGLSAVQCGIPWNLFVIKGPDGYDCFANAKYYPINPKLGTFNSQEGCLSLPGKTYEVQRHYCIILDGWLFTERGMRLYRKHHEVISDNRYAENNIYTICLQHEADHALGILISETGVLIEN